MKRHLSLIAACITASLLSTTRTAGSAEPRLKVLIVDGQNNHNWRATTPVLRAILEDAEIFAVDVATTPKNMAGFRPEFSKYDAILSNYNGADWPEGTRRALVDYVRSGGGLVVVHAADNAFPRWKEFNEMIGVGGWGGRNEKSGPMVYWKDGEYVFDKTPGGGGSHGAQHAFQIMVRDRSHPITRGLPEKWMHAKDELYSNLRGPARNMKVLATAYADPKTGGTGRHEPMLFTVGYGKGRVFHTVLGHDVLPMKCAGFVLTLQRGTQWAAKGRVTLTAVPGNFPTSDQVRFWLPDTTFASIRTYDFGKSRRDLTAIEEATRGASPAELKEIEAKLLVALDDSGTTYAGKQFVIRVLRRIGTERSVGPLSKLLTDEKLSHMARFALQHLPSAEATTALRNGLERCEGRLEIGIISSLGARGDRSAVDSIVPYLGGGDPARVETAIRALARLGGRKAAGALVAASVSGKLRATRDRALLACGDGMLAGGHGSRAVRIYRRLADDPSSDSFIRLAAHRGIFIADRERALPAVLSLLEGEDPILRQGAIKLITTTSGEAVTRALARQLPDLDPESQVAVIRALVERQDRVAYASVLKAVSSSNERVKIAAVEALGGLGDADTVKPLLRLSLADGDVGQAAFRSLTAVRGDGVVPVLLRVARSGPPAARVKAIEALVVRHESKAVPALMAAAGEPDAEVRTAAYEALSSLAGEKDLGGLVSMLVERKYPTERAHLGRAIRSVAERLKDRESATGILAAALEKADNPCRVILLGILPILSTGTGLEAIREQLRSGEDDVVTAAVEALASWKNADPLPDLLALAKEDAAPARQAVAINGYIKLVSMPAERPSVATVRLLGEALELAKNVKDRKKILSSLPRVPCKEALDLASSYAEDQEIGEAARTAARKIKGLILASGKVATASHHSNQTKNAFDGDSGTRWTTGEPMRPGMWFMVDMGLEQKISRIILDTRGSSGDYPRGCEVYVSFDGKSWGKPVLTSKPQRPITRLVFSEPVRARFVKIVQTGRTEGLFWSIHKMRIDVE